MAHQFSHLQTEDDFINYCFYEDSRVVVLSETSFYILDLFFYEVKHREGGHVLKREPAFEVVKKVEWNEISYFSMEVKNRIDVYCFDSKEKVYAASISPFDAFVVFLYLILDFIQTFSPEAHLLFIVS